MEHKAGMPCLKLNNVGRKSKHCGSFEYVAKEALRERCGRDSDIDPERTHLNIYGGYETAEELMAYSRKHVEELSLQLRNEGKRGIRNDAVVMMAAIFKLPMEYLNELSLEESKRLFSKFLKKFSEIVGAENIKSWAIYFDELNPHVHVFWEPMTEDGRLCAKEVCNLKFFSRLNKEMPIYLREQGFDIADCEAYDAGLDKSEFLGEVSEERRKSKKQHGVDSRTFKYQQEQKKEKLDKEIEDRKAIKAGLDEVIKSSEIEASKKADMIIDEANTRAGDIVNTANNRAKDILKAANSEASEIINKAKIESREICNDAKKQADNLIDVGNAIKRKIDNDTAELQKEYDELYEKYVKMKQESEALEEQIKRLNEEYEFLQNQVSTQTNKRNHLEKQIAEKENLLLELTRCFGYIIWKIFDMVISGASNIIHFVKEGDIGIAQFTLNDHKDQALKQAENLAPEFKDEMDQAIQLITAVMEERYIREYKK